MGLLHLLLKWKQLIMPKNKKYIYESPDKGKTVYRREMGSNKEREKVYFHRPEFNDMLSNERTAVGIDILQRISKLLEEN